MAQLIAFLLVFLIVKVNSSYNDYYNRPVCAKFQGYCKSFPNIQALMTEIQYTGNPWHLVDISECENGNMCPQNYSPVCGYSVYLNIYSTFPNKCVMNVASRTSGLAWVEANPLRCSESYNSHYTESPYEPLTSYTTSRPATTSAYDEIAPIKPPPKVEAILSENATIAEDNAINEEPVIINFEDEAEVQDDEIAVNDTREFIAQFEQRVRVVHVRIIDNGTEEPASEETPTEAPTTVESPTEPTEPEFEFQFEHFVEFEILSNFSEHATSRPTTSAPVTTTVAEETTTTESPIEPTTSTLRPRPTRFTQTVIIEVEEPTTTESPTETTAITTEAIPTVAVESSPVPTAQTAPPLPTAQTPPQTVVNITEGTTTVGTTTEIPTTTTELPITESTTIITEEITTTTILVEEITEPSTTELTTEPTTTEPTTTEVTTITTEAIPTKEITTSPLPTVQTPPGTVVNITEATTPEIPTTTTEPTLTESTTIISEVSPTTVAPVEVTTTAATTTEIPTTTTEPTTLGTGGLTTTQVPIITEVPVEITTSGPTTTEIATEASSVVLTPITESTTSPAVYIPTEAYPAVQQPYNTVIEQPNTYYPYSSIRKNQYNRYNGQYAEGNIYHQPYYNVYGRIPPPPPPPQIPPPSIPEVIIPNIQYWPTFPYSPYKYLNYNSYPGQVPSSYGYAGKKK